MNTLFAVLCVLILPALFCLSLLDISLRSVNYHKISSIHRHGNKNAEKLFSLLSSPERSISVLLFLRYTLTAFLFLTAGITISQAQLAIGFKLALLPISILFILILLEYIPRMLAVQNPERTAFTMLKPFELVLRWNRYFPLPQACEKFASRLLRIYGFNVERIFSQYSVNEIKMFLSLRRSNEDPELKKTLINTQFMDFSERRIKEVMVPRPFVKAVEINTPLQTLLRFEKEHGYSRMPVFRSSLDNILGVLHIKDTIGADQSFSIESVLHKPFFIPETATIQAAFQNMRRNRAHMAIVVDEYGGVDGIVTLEDLIEELIGEIHDEFDEDIQMLQKVTEGSWILEGNLPIQEFNQTLSIGIPEDSSYTTVAGFLLSILDKIPAEKDQIRYGDLVFTIEKMTGHKISKVSLKTPIVQKHSS